jgi:hypothetical protein
MAKGRDLQGRWLPGHSGAPRELQLQPGHPWRYPRGVSGNPGGSNRRLHEFNQLQREALLNPELLHKCMAKLEEAINAGESWAIMWYLAKVFPDGDKKNLLATKLQVTFVEKPFPANRLIEAAAEPDKGH